MDVDVERRQYNKTTKETIIRFIFSNIKYSTFNLNLREPIRQLRGHLVRAWN
jgi:hypothetical protein